MKSDYHILEWQTVLFSSSIYSDYSKSSDADTSLSSKSQVSL